VRSPRGCVGEGVMVDVSDERVDGVGEAAHPMHQTREVETQVADSDERSERTRPDSSNIAVQDLGYRNAPRM